VVSDNLRCVDSYMDPMRRMIYLSLVDSNRPAEIVSESFFRKSFVNR